MSAELELVVKSLEVNNKVKYTITYRIDENRFWFYKDEYQSVKDKWYSASKIKLVNINSHFTKQDLNGSVDIINNIIERLELVNELDNIKTFSYIVTDDNYDDISKIFIKTKKKLEGILLH